MIRGAKIGFVGEGVRPAMVRAADKTVGRWVDLGLYWIGHGRQEHFDKRNSTGQRYRFDWYSPGTGLFRRVPIALGSTRKDLLGRSKRKECGDGSCDLLRASIRGRDFVSEFRQDPGRGTWRSRFSGIPLHGKEDKVDSPGAHAIRIVVARGIGCIHTVARKNLLISPWRWLK